jgi:hypothetical protein
LAPDIQDPVIKSSKLIFETLDNKPKDKNSMFRVGSNLVVEGPINMDDLGILVKFEESVS